MARVLHPNICRADAEDKKPIIQSDERVSLKINSQDGTELFFKIKRHVQLKKLMIAYCNKKSAEFDSVVFLFEGRQLTAEQTPEQLEMENGDEIDAMLHQVGGAV